MINLKKDGLTIAALTLAACVFMYSDQAKAILDPTDWDNHTIPDPKDDSQDLDLGNPTLKCGTHVVVIEGSGESIVDNGKRHNVVEANVVGDNKFFTYTDSKIKSIVSIGIYSDKRLMYTNNTMSKAKECQFITFLSQ